MEHEDSWPDNAVFLLDRPQQPTWQDPIPAVDHPLIGEADISALKAKILASGLSVAQLVAPRASSRDATANPARSGGPARVPT
jgi:catalase-peroxidase